MMEPTEHAYKNMPYEDNDHTNDESLSNTEVDESLLGDDKQIWHEKDLHRSRSRRSRFFAFLRSCRWMIDTSLLLIILGFIVREQWKTKDVNEWQFGGDLTGVGPKFSQKITTFQMDSSYAPSNTSEFFTPEVLNKWNQLMPIGMGFVWVNDTHRYHDLPTPIVWDQGKTVFTTSLTHQLHCLFAIVQTYSGLTSNTTIPDDHHWHMIHCFDYMRQTIMCNADIALEGLETTFPDHNGGSDGWDAKHVCKDYKQVTNYLESVRAYDDREIF